MGLRRRGLLLLGLSGVATTVTAASWLRKPPEYVLRTPVATPPVELRGLDGLVPTEPPRPMPDFTYQDSEGGTHSLNELRGRPVLLNLWATWCQPCIVELPSLAALAAGQPKSGLAVVALSTDRGGAATVRAFFARHGIDLPVWVDPAAASALALGARGLPTTILIDRDGRERGRFEGATDWASPAARAAIERAVA